MIYRGSVIEGGACPDGRICQNGGCCPPPLPQCPDGVPATVDHPKHSSPRAARQCWIFERTCGGPGTCGNSEYCYEQGPARGCCAIPLCPNGGAAVQPCGSAQFPSCPDNNFQCINGGCCPIPLPTCPNGQPARVTCSGTCAPSNTDFCYTDNAGVAGCCPIPICPDTGSQAVQPCFDNPNSCPAASGGSAYQCVNGGCCPLPVCPDGSVGQQRCSGPADCGVGFACQNGACCPVSCPNGGQPIQVCGANGCPSGYACYMVSLPPLPYLPLPSISPFQTQCCPAPPPTCPNGAPAISTCPSGVCPQGYSCQGGGCCLNQVAPPRPVQPACPPVQQPLCYCASYNNACPQQSSCNGGTCCASGHLISSITF